MPSHREAYSFRDQIGAPVSRSISLRIYLHILLTFVSDLSGQLGDLILLCKYEQHFFLCLLLMGLIGLCRFFNLNNRIWIWLGDRVLSIMLTPPFVPPLLWPLQDYGQGGTSFSQVNSWGIAKCAEMRQKVWLHRQNSGSCHFCGNETSVSFLLIARPSPNLSLLL